MIKYLISAFLILSVPQMCFAEQTLEIKNTNRTSSYIDDWLAYKDFSHKKQQIVDANVKIITELFHQDLEGSFDQITLANQTQNRKIAVLVQNLSPQEKELKEIKKLWSDILLNQSQNLDELSDSDQIHLKMEKIEILGSTLEKKFFHVIQSKKPPEYVMDWMNYKKLKFDLEEKHNALDQRYNNLSHQADERMKVELQQKFIQSIAQTKLDLLNDFSTHSSELQEIIDLQIKVVKAAEKMNLNAISDSSIHADEMNNLSEISDEVDERENRLEDKIVEYIRSVH